MRQALVIANPAASRGGVAKQLVKMKRLTGEYAAVCSFDFMVTENPLHATELARVNAPNYDLVVAFGGDGTINEVANGLMGGDTPLGVIPFGTGNDFARGAGIPLGLKPALELVCRGTPLPTDVGIVNGRYFVNAVGIGFDGRTNYEASKIKGLKGPLVILVAIFRTMRFWQAVPMTLTVDGESLSGPSYLVGIGNGPSIGGGLKLTPQARLDDGQLSVCRAADIPPWKILLNFPRLKSGTMHKLKEVTMLSGSKITVESEQPLPVHVDGEVLGLELTRLDLEIQPSALRIVRNPAQGGS